MFHINIFKYLEFSINYLLISKDIYDLYLRAVKLYDIKITIKGPFYDLKKIITENFKYGIHTLDLSHCFDITEMENNSLYYLNYEISSGFTELNKLNLKSIHTLNISKCYFLKDADLQLLKGIHSLNISQCYNITDISALAGGSYTGYKLL